MAAVDTSNPTIHDFEIGELDCYLFGNGTHYEIYKKMGAHPVTYDGKKGVYFVVWAPHARSVRVVGDFNEWNDETHYMQCNNQGGIYTLFIEGVEVGELY